jgi:hypothetical protein
MKWSHPFCQRRSERITWKDKANMHYLQKDAPRKEIYLSPQVGDLSLRVDLNLLESLQRYAGDVENKGTTRSSVDPKLRKRRDLKKLLL